MKEVMINRTFSDKHGFDWMEGLAMLKFTEFYNKYPFIKLVLVVNRQKIIENGGDGTCYYDIDVAFLVDKKYCEKNYLEEYILKGEEL